MFRKFFCFARRSRAEAGRSSLAKTGELKLRKEKNIARKRKLFKMKRKEGRKAGLMPPTFGWVNFFLLDRLIIL